jgi:hypothetical protein
MKVLNIWNGNIEMRKMKLVIQMTGIIISVMILSSCAQIVTTGTQTVQLSTPSIAPSNPVSTDSSTALPSSGIISPMPYEQIYIDPVGQYAIKFSVDWKPTDKQNSFIGDDGFFETGYLPNLGFVSSGINVCVWLANMDAKSEQETVWLHYDNSTQSSRCEVVTTDSGLDHIEIYENPGADYEHRFVYLKARGGKVPVTFWWLEPMNEKEPEFNLISLRPEDASFWASNASIPPEISVKEYALPPKAQTDGPANAMLLHYVPPEMIPTSQENNTNTSHEKPTIHEQLRPYGYELRTFDTGDGQHQKLYRDGRILFDKVYQISDVHTFSTESGPITTFTVTTMNKPEFSDISSYIIQNDVISEWRYDNNDPPFAPILYKGEVLWVRAAENAHVQVQKSNRDVVFSFATYFGTRLPVNGFEAWNDHWILEVGDFVIQDGEILNENFGFEEVFNWSLVNNRPVYFFRKGPRIGLSYDGQFIPLNYRDVAHGFCCALTINNPSVIDNTVRFFGKRDSVWYYVIVEVN